MGRQEQKLKKQASYRSGKVLWRTRGNGKKSEVTLLKPFAQLDLASPGRNKRLTEPWPHLFPSQHEGNGSTREKKVPWASLSFRPEDFPEQVTLTLGAGRKGRLH